MSAEEQKRVQDEVLNYNSMISLTKYISALHKNDKGVYHDAKLTKLLHGILASEHRESMQSLCLIYTL